MNKNQKYDNDDDASSSSTKKFKTSNNSGVSPWLNLNHGVLLFIIMQLSIADFLSFSKVCKSWRSLALTNKNIFMSSRPPMKIYIFRHPHHYIKNSSYMEDFEGKKIETVFPCSSPVTFCGVTCGYLILYLTSRHNFLLLNPITGHQLHFPNFNFHTRVNPMDVNAILVFSPSISKWVFVVSYKQTAKMSFYVTGKRGWNHVTSTLPILDLHFFKGKVYTLHTDCCLGEIRFNLKPNLILHKTKNLTNVDMKDPKFISSGDHLYITSYSYVKDENRNKLLELDFEEMKWVSPEKTVGKYVFFTSNFKNYAAIRRESWDWANTKTRDKIYNYFSDKYCPRVDKTGESLFFSATKWYFPHECLDVNRLDD